MPLPPSELFFGRCVLCLYSYSLGCPKKIRDLIFPYFCSKSENLCIKTHPDQILGYSEHKSSFIIEVEVLLVCFTSKIWNRLTFGFINDIFAYKNCDFFCIFFSHNPGKACGNIISKNYLVKFFTIMCYRPNYSRRFWHFYINFEIVSILAWKMTFLLIGMVIFLHIF